jgi:NAD(P)-dependent dehydrogenase (short-subunit alcohol dehydrogenase family)
LARVLDLKDRVVIITGGAGGIGREEALLLGRLGASVVVNDVGVRSDDTATDETTWRAAEVADEITAAGGSAAHSTADPSDIHGARAVVDLALDRFGRLDAIVNNAGIVRDGMVFNLGMDDWEDVLRVHLGHTFAMTHVASNHWRARAKAGDPVAGRIVNTTSAAGLLGNVGQANYGAAKAGIAAFTVIVAQELERYGVTCNAISPVARTPMTAGLAAPPSDNGFDELDPANVAPLVAYLVSDQADWITGQVLRIAGGAVNRYKGWTIEEGFDVGKRLEPDELDLRLRRLYGVYPLGMTASPSRRT